jgi:hypothetical protein
MKALLLGGAVIIIALLALKWIDGSALPQGVAATERHTTIHTSKNLITCLKELKEVDGGWCEMRVEGDMPGRSNAASPAAPSAGGI